MGARAKNQISRPGEPEVFGFINAFDKSEQGARLERVQTLWGLAIPLCLRYLVASNRRGWTRGQTERDVSGKQLQRWEQERERGREGGMRGLLYEMLCSLWPHQISLSVPVSYSSLNKTPDCRVSNITPSLSVSVQHCSFILFSLRRHSNADSFIAIFSQAISFPFSLGSLSASFILAMNKHWHNAASNETQSWEENGQTIKINRQCGRSKTRQEEVSSPLDSNTLDLR